MAGEPVRLGELLGALRRLGLGPRSRTSTNLAPCSRSDAPRQAAARGGRDGRAAQAGGRGGGHADCEVGAAIARRPGSPPSVSARPCSRTSLGEPGALTDREVEVLRLPAAGRSKREIAGRLVLSPATVHTHTVHIYAKAGVSRPHDRHPPGRARLRRSPDAPLPLRDGRVVQVEQYVGDPEAVEAFWA